MSGAAPAFCRRLIDALDAAVCASDPATITERVRGALCDLIRGGEIRLPERFSVCASDHYARRLLHRDDSRGYSAVVMTWGPGQVTPLHDHAGLWCVDGVLAGNVEVRRYELLGEENGLFRLAERETVAAGVGEAGALIPPFEHHVIANASTDRSAMTLHVYGGEMRRCSVFLPERNDWYRREEKTLGFDA